VNRKISVLVADDHLLMRESLRGILEKTQFVKEIYEAENGKQAMDLLAQHAIDVALLDIRMPEVDGFEVIAYVHKLRLSTRTIALTAFDEEAMIFNLMKTGVDGILFKKTTHQQEIYTAIITVLEGKHYYNEKVQVAFENKPDGIAYSLPIKLTAREFQITTLLCKGLNTISIAEKLFLSKHTIESYRKEILRKTNSKNTNELIAFAIRSGIISS
jgi:DNA-binding NarL/FixJ family response regulator